MVDEESPEFRAWNKKMINTSFKMTRMVLAMLAVWSVVILVWAIHLVIVKATAKPPTLSDKRLFKRDQPTNNIGNGVKYEDLVFYTVFNDIPTQSETDLSTAIKIFVGGFHQLKEADGLVPTLLIYLNTTTSLLNDQDAEALEIKTKVKVLDGQLIGMKEIERRARNFHPNQAVIWISSEYAFDPVQLDIKRAGLLSDEAMFRAAYKKGREIILQIYRSGHDVIIKNKPVLKIIQRARDIYDNTFLQYSSNSLSAKKYLSIDEIFNFPLVPIKTLATTTDLQCYVDLDWSILKYGARLLNVNDFKKLENISRLNEREKFDSIAIGIPTTSKGISVSNKKHVMLTTLLPSLVKTTKNYPGRIVLFIGFDRGDEYFENEIWREALSKDIQKILQDAASPQQKIDFVFLSLIPLKRVAQAWNQIFSLARGIIRFKYFYQVNDDLTFETEGWAEQFIGALKSVGDVGVSGPSDSFNQFECSLLTQAFVSEKHFQIFSGRFYPIEISDWKSDRWLSFVYPSSRTFCWLDVKARNGGAATRYETKCPYLGWKVSLDRDQKIVSKYLTSSKGGTVSTS